MIELTEKELRAVRLSVRNSIDLYARYVLLRPEDAKMGRKQTRMRRRLGYLRTAEHKLRA